MSKSYSRPLLAALFLAACCATSSQAKPSSTPVSFRAAEANKGRHISAYPKGGLVLGTTVPGGKEIFNLIDLNGGPLKTGDMVQITFDSGNRPSYWRESEGKISRSGKEPDAACVFKVVWKQPNVSLMLRAASGKFVSGPGKGQPIAVVAKGDPTTVFTLIKNPHYAKAAPKPAKMAQRRSKSEPLSQ